MRGGKKEQIFREKRSGVVSDGDEKASDARLSQTVDEPRPNRTARLGLMREGKNRQKRSEEKRGEFAQG